MTSKRISLNNTYTTSNSNPYKVAPILSKSLPPSSNLSPRTKKLHDFDLSQSGNSDKRYSDITTRKGDHHNTTNINYLDEIKQYEQENYAEKYQEYVAEVRKITAAWKIKDYINIIRRKDLKRENKVLSSKILATQEHNVEIQEQLDYLEKEHKIAISRIKTYEENDSIMKKAEAELKATVENERQKRSIVLANIDKDKEEMNNKVTEFEEKYISMERQKNKAEQKIDIIKTELDVNQSQLKEVLAQLGSVQMELFASKAEVAKLLSIDDLLQDANKTVNDKQEMIEHQRIKIQEYEDEIAKMKLVYSHQQQQYDFLADAVNKEKAEKMSLQNVVSDLAFQLKDGQIKISGLEGTVSNNETKIQELDSKILEKDKKIIEFQEKLKLAIRHIENLKYKNESANRQKECFNMLVEDMEEHMRYDSELISNTSKYCEFLEEQVLNLRKKIPQTLDNTHNNVFRSRYDKNTPPNNALSASSSKTKSNNKIDNIKRNESIGISSIPSDGISANSKNMSRDIVSITNLLNDDSTSTPVDNEYRENADELENVDDDAFSFNDPNYDNGYIKINPMFDSLTPQAETDQMFERMEQLEERLTSMLHTFEEKLISSHSSAPLGITSDVLNASIEHAGRKQLEYLEKSLKIMERRISTYSDDLKWIKGEIQKKMMDIKVFDKKIFLDFKDQQNQWKSKFTDNFQRQPTNAEITNDFVFSNTSSHVNNLQRLLGNLVSSIQKARQKKKSIDFLETKVTKVNGALLFLSKNTNDSVDSSSYWESLGLGSLEDILEEMTDPNDQNSNPMWLLDVNANTFDLSSLLTSQQEYVDKGLREINISPCSYQYSQTLFGKLPENKPEIARYNEEIDEKKKALLEICNTISKKQQGLEKLVSFREAKLGDLEKWEDDFSRLYGRNPDDDEKMESRPYQLLFLSYTNACNDIEACNIDIQNSHNELISLVKETNVIIKDLHELTYESQEEVSIKFYLDIIEKSNTDILRDDADGRRDDE